MVRRASLWLLVLTLGGCARCGGKESDGVAEGGTPPPAGLSADEAKLVLAEVGERRITVGEFAAVLERMGPYERMRYQAPERRKELLDEMITVELLAAEAVAKGYDKDPLTQVEIDAALRDALLAKLRREAPAPESVPVEQVRAWYNEHKEMFVDPPRRRVAVIATKTKAEAEAAIAELKGDKSAVRFGELVRKKSVLDDAKAEVPLDLAGDLGIVSAPGELRGQNRRIPEPVRKALFALGEAGDTSQEPVKDDSPTDQAHASAPKPGLFYVVRLVQALDARERTFEEAERSIRVRLASDAAQAKEDAFLKELEKKYPIAVDEAALAKVQDTPAPLPPADPHHGHDHGEGDAHHHGAPGTP